MVPEAPLEPTEHGLVPTGDGWFVLNARETRWWDRPGCGARACSRRGGERRSEAGVRALSGEQAVALPRGLAPGSRLAPHRPDARVRAGPPATAGRSVRLRAQSVPVSFLFAISSPHSG